MKLLANNGLFSQRVLMSQKCWQNGPKISIISTRIEFEAFWFFILVDCIRSKKHSDMGLHQNVDQKCQKCNAMQFQTAFLACVSQIFFHFSFSFDTHIHTYFGAFEATYFFKKSQQVLTLAQSTRYKKVSNIMNRMEKI